VQQPGPESLVIPRGPSSNRALRGTRTSCRWPCDRCEMLIEDWSTLAIDKATADDVVGSIKRAVLDCAEAGRLLPRVKDCIQNPGFWRLDFSVPIESFLLDRFANDRSGYRGHYFDSPVDGSNFNARIVGELVEILLSAAKANPVSQRLAPGALIRSIKDAKIWPGESVDSNSCSCKQWQWSSWSDNKRRFWTLLRFEEGLAELEITEWMRDSFDENTQDFGPFRFIEETVTIKGAFVKETENEPFVPPSKRFRPLQIHCFGAS